MFKSNVLHSLCNISSAPIGFLKSDFRHIDDLKQICTLTFVVYVIPQTFLDMIEKVTIERASNADGLTL